MIHSKLEINGNEIIKYNVNTGSMMETKLIDLSVELDADLFIEYGYNKIADMNLTTNNNIGLKYSYLKCKTKKETFEVVEFSDIEEHFEAYQSMQSYEMNKKPSKTTFNINFIKDCGSEYNNYVLIYWFL